MSFMAFLAVILGWVLMDLIGLFAFLTFLTIIKLTKDKLSDFISNIIIKFQRFKFNVNLTAII